jgi:3-hydroxy-5-methyl-1-naphthoate 3-O-methyltransferase
MSATNPTQVTPERIMQFAWAYATPLIIEAAIRNRIFDELDAGPKSAAELQAATGAPARGLTAIANVLVGLDLLAKDEAGRYSLTPESAAFLVPSKPSFMGGLILHTSGQIIPRWLHLNEVVRTGKPFKSVNQEETGAAFFEELVLNIFPMSYAPAKALAEHLGLSAATAPVSVLDLATGSGVWGIALAQSSPQIRVTAVDWPGVLPTTQKTVAKFGLTDRYSFSPGDLLEADFGSGHQVAILGHILHSEGKKRSHALLAKTFTALAPGATIAVQEFLVNKDRTGPLNGLIFAVNMLINTDEGGTWSFEEISDWLREAGFVNPRTLDSPGPSPLILATKP